MSYQMTLNLTVNATSSLESEAGHAPFISQVGQKIAPYG